LLLEARKIVARTLETSSTEEKTDWGASCVCMLVHDVVKDKIRADLKRYISKQTARRPLIMPVILEV